MFMTPRIPGKPSGPSTSIRSHVQKTARHAGTHHKATKPVKAQSDVEAALRGVLWFVFAVAFLLLMQANA